MNIIIMNHFSFDPNLTHGVHPPNRGEDEFRYVSYRNCLSFRTLAISFIVLLVLVGIKCGSSGSLALEICLVQTRFELRFGPSSMDLMVSVIILSKCASLMTI